MGLVLSMCKQKKPRYDKTIVQHTYTQTTIPTANHSPSISSEKTHCSAISREPITNPSFRRHYYFPSEQPIYSTASQQRRGYPDFPIFSTPFYMSSQHSNPYIAQAYSHVPAAISPSIHSTDHSRTTLTTTTPDPCRTPTISDVVQSTGDEYQTLRRVESFVTTDGDEPSSKKDLDDRARLIKRSASTPIDMFLIDISNEHVLIDQPVSMNIRHLLLDSLENHQSNASTPVRIDPSNITTYAHENLLAYIPYVCERYPNVTIESDQRTRNTLHVRVPSQFSRSLNSLS